MIQDGRATSILAILAGPLLPGRERFVPAGTFPFISAPRSIVVSCLGGLDPSTSTARQMVHSLPKPLAKWNLFVADRLRQDHAAFSDLLLYNRRSANTGKQK